MMVGEFNNDLMEIVGDGQALLNLTINGQSGYARFPVDADADDHTLKRQALEMVRAGDFPGIDAFDADDHVLDDFQIDRFPAKDGVPSRRYLRSKTPVG